MPRPGDLTAPFAGGPISMYLAFPVDDIFQGIPELKVDASDGFLFVLAHVEKWCYVVTTSLKMGWVFEYDVGADKVAGSVFAVP